MFGEFTVDNRKNFIVGKKKFEVFVQKNVVKYSGPGGEKVVGNLGRRVNVFVIPAPLVGKYMSFLVVWLVDDIIVPPKSSVPIWVSLPIGVRVTVNGVLVDVFNSDKIKRCYFECLSNNGIVTGCAKVRGIVSYDRVKLVGGLNFIVKNASSSPVIVKKFPILMKNTPLFYDGENAYYPWYKIVVNDNYATVTTNFTSPVNNLRSTGVLYVPGFEANLEITKKEEKIVICP